MRNAEALELSAKALERDAKTKTDILYARLYRAWLKTEQKTTWTKIWMKWSRVLTKKGHKCYA